MVACRQWHSTDEDAADYIRIIEQGNGHFPNIRVKNLFLTCFHCAEPPCIRVCPTGAISKRAEDGIVLVSESKCLGKEECGARCSRACPYHAPRFKERLDAKMEKCDACVDRLAQGKEALCVAACPLHALEFGWMGEVGNEVGVAKAVEGFPAMKRIAPSVIFKAKK